MKDSWLSWFLRGVLILAFLILFARLFELQIIKGSYIRKLAEENRIRHTPISAPRGRILARGGEVLVGNREGAKREYPLKDSAAHLTGYLGEVGENEVGRINPDCPEKGPFLLGALIGRGGLEEEYECILSGTPGEELVEVDTKGQRIRTLGRREPVPGKDLKTTVDFNLQKKVAEVMQGKKGAVIVTDTKGEVLALYSSPSFDPGAVSEYLGKEDQPFFDRAISGTFHPGSTFKPLVAIAALEEGKIDKDFTFEDRGEIKIETPYGDFTYANWYFTQYGKTEGKIDLVRAITRSTDTFFYSLGELVGPEKIVFWAHKFGLNEETGIDLPGETSGLIPTPEWKRRVKGEQWFLGNTYHLAIGQGDIALTPLEMNMMTGAIANGGKLCKPFLKTPKLQNSSCQNIGVKKENLDLVKKGMVGACSPGGTGYTFFDFKPEVGCKTGTAEVGPDGTTHAWFTLFAPDKNPEITLTVLVERSGEGSKVAGPIARKIMDFWNLQKNP